MEKSPLEFQRCLFEQGMLLTAEDLSNLQLYQDNKRKLLSRSVLGSGIVCGLAVKLSDGYLSIAPGLALDQLGREIVLSQEVVCQVQDLNEKSLDQHGSWLLCLEYTEYPTGESFLIRNEPLQETVPNRLVESYTIFCLRERRDNAVCIAELVWDISSGQMNILRAPVDVYRFYNYGIKKNEIDIHTGNVLFEQRSEGYLNVVLFSGEIPHGFGARQVVDIALSLENNLDGRFAKVSGNVELFLPQVALAVKQYPATGTFVIALRLAKEPLLPPKVYWQAICKKGTQ